MCDSYPGIKLRMTLEETDEGFTLLEVLIVIVVLGILAAVVIFALGGITSKGAVASCQADGTTVQVALAAFNQQNPGLSAGITSTSLTSTATTYAGPYIQSWPSNSAHYTYTLVGGVLKLAIGTGAPNTYTGPGMCSTAS
jgi:prepilin-type N-terminal cleavage/methylation domain-containing protein